MTNVDKAAIGWSIAIVAVAIGFTLAGQSEPTESVSSGFGVTLDAVDCSLGQFAAPGDLVCTDAPAGTFVDKTGATEATLCPAGTWSSEPGAISCMVCPSCNTVGS